MLSYGVVLVILMVACGLEWLAILWHRMAGHSGVCCYACFRMQQFLLAEVAIMLSCGVVLVILMLVVVPLHPPDEGIPSRACIL